MKKLLILCFLSLFFLTGCGCFSGNFQDYAGLPRSVPVYGSDGMDPIEPIVELNRQVRFITHGAGEIDGFAGSNSREALEGAYEEGCRFIELDFNFTADGELACIHDWYTQYSSAITDNVPLTAAAFRDCRIYDAYTPMLLDDAAAYLERYDDLYIVTDIKDDNIAGLTYIAAKYPHLRDRFIAQIYSEDEYSVVWDLGFENIIFTLYRLDWTAKTDVENLRKFAEEHLLFAYTFASQLCDLDGYTEDMLTCGVPLYVHTVNGEAEQEKYFAMGISAIYTDERKNGSENPSGVHPAA
ncbi:MAG: hypothetical protein IJ325_08695 [Clostridia bacterium]|nr:hypothetical protein [Clostridia bacterium]